MGLAVDSTGVIYIGETSGHRIRKIDLDGKIYTVAGNGTAGSVGEDVLVSTTDPQVDYPTALAVDQDDNLYFSDKSQYKIRVILKSNQHIKTIGGNGTGGDVDGAQADSEILFPFDDGD